MDSNRLIIFVRAPVPGTVKTRLARALGGDGACDAYKMMVSDLRRNLASLGSVELHYTPAAARDMISGWLANTWTASPQGDGDLGARLQAAFQAAFDQGARRVVLIGSDAPEVTADDIHSAWAALGGAELVLGPALDGGYWLIGLTRPQSALFEKMPWGTDRVLVETQARATALGLSAALLRRLGDIDTVEDWESYLRRRQTGGL